MEKSQQSKSSLTILFKSLELRQKLENIWRKYVNQNIINEPLSNILQNNFELSSYCQKYQRPRRQYLIELLSIIGLSRDQGTEYGNLEEALHTILLWL